MQELKQFLISVLDGENSTINEISNDFNHKEQFQRMVKDLCLTEQLFEIKLKTIATTVLSNSKNNGCFASLLIFSIELDTFHSRNSSWYRRDVLVTTLHDVFLKSNKQYDVCKIGRYMFWQYALFLFFCTIIVVLF